MREPAGRGRSIAAAGTVAIAWLAVVVTAALGAALPRAAAHDPFPLDAAGARWVDQTLKALSLDEEVGQLIVPAFETSFLSTDSDRFDDLARLVRDYHVGGFLLFGARQPAPAVLLDSSYGTVLLGQALAAASIANRLQALSTVPLLNSSDFETGAGFRIAGATAFPRQMAMGAIAGADAVRLVREEARVTAVEARALGVQVNFAPIADVNDNPRNPVINTRSYGEDPARVASLVSAYVETARQNGLIATLKHFPGHGDTDVDSHIGLPVIAADRARLNAVELVPFRAGIDAGAQAVMSAHIELPSIDATPSTPATFSAAVVNGLLRHDLAFAGLEYTDAMNMDAVVRLMPPDEAAVRAVLAGADQIEDSPDPVAAVRGLKAAVASGRIAKARLDESVARVLRAKAFAGLHKQRTVSLDDVPAKVGGRAAQALAQEAAARAVTLIKDDRHQVPLRIARDVPVLYLSVLDYPAGWQIAAPSRTFIPELRKRWPDVTAIELSDHTPAAELDLVRVTAPRYGAIVASVFVRTTSGSGRMDLDPRLVRLLQDLAQTTARTGAPFDTVFFGNPYTASFVPELPAMMLTYDFYDLAELAAVRALAGEAPVSGTLPISLPGLFPVGHGLTRPAKSADAHR